MKVPPKAPPVYKPSAPAITATPVYKPQQASNRGVQLKPGNHFRMETRPAPPVYRPNQVNTRTAQLKPANTLRVETRPAPPAYKPQQAQLRVGSSLIQETRVVPPVYTPNPVLRPAIEQKEAVRMPMQQPIQPRLMSADLGPSRLGAPMPTNAGSRQSFPGYRGYSDGGSLIQAMKRKSKEVESQTVKGKKAANMVVEFIHGEKGTTDNWTVAVLDNEDLIIGKVNGVTSATDFTQNLAEFIRENSIEEGRDIFLAGNFNSVSSRHAEMCILAAADALGKGITYMLCVAPNCDFCAKMLSDAGVPSAAYQGSDPTSQQGWTHPRKKVGYGTQLVAPLKEQLKELGELNNGDIDEDDITKGQKLGVAPKGKSEKWM